MRLIEHAEATFAFFPGSRHPLPEKLRGSRGPRLVRTRCGPRTNHYDRRAS
jgi:hypothetical protein